MATVTVIAGYSEVTDTDIVIPLFPSTISQIGMIYYNDPDAINLDINGNTKSIYPWVGSKKLMPINGSTTNAPAIVTDSLGNKLWVTVGGSTKYLIPTPATGNCPISTADFSLGYSAFFMHKETDNTLNNKLFQIFGNYFSIYTISSVRTFEGKKLATPSNGTIQATAPTTNVLHQFGVTVDVATQTAKLFVDGVQVATNTSAAWVAYLTDGTLTSTTWFGANGTATTNSSAGQFGAFAIYNKALGSTDITALWTYWKSKYGL